jgi:hypothetical protein
MELWIRSQDKNELVKIEEVCIHIDEDGFIGIWSYGSNKNLKYYLGNYSTKERALEVLNKIQERIVNLQLVSLEEKGKARKDVYTTPYLECVYQMPKE